MAQKRRLLLINYEFPPLGGGAGTATLNIARELTALGAEVTVLTSAFAGLPKREMMHGYEVIRIPTLRRRKDRCSVVEMTVFIISAAFHCLPIARGIRADIAIVFFSIPCGPIGYLLKRILGLPYIVSLRGGDVPGYLGKELAFYHWLTAPLTRLVWRQAAHVVANSGGLQQLARQALPEIKIEVIPNGVDLNSFVPAQHPASGGPLALLSVGRLHVQKGLDVLLQAMAKLPPQLRDACRLILVGDGPERGPLQELASQLGLSQLIEFRGWVDRAEIAAIYAAADLFVFPSRDEGMPNAVLEAMASGLPIVATRISGSEELVVEGGNGLLVEVDDAEALAAALGRLIENASLRMQMGHASRQRIEERYSWPLTAKAYYDMAAASGLATGRVDQILDTQ
ncbi:glycosyltransferase family 4 protein [Dongia soli]|uniref:Glycosyltransferase family 4 protein n=1 Tax=Dongia soli TaxID=600628 RepID=A0ABU5EDS3_9PROT|nr:glycosyltransferase family 4 protein [Dongia soli]MDY0884062.1 glycosyltransferase family 4 protein [Dongia soli]